MNDVGSDPCNSGDGAISKKELTSHLCAAGYAEEAVINIFNKLDTNNDGELSPDEVRWSPVFQSACWHLFATRAPGISS